jgi:hypothetical protein
VLNKIHHSKICQTSVVFFKHIYISVSLIASTDVFVSLGIKCLICVSLTTFASFYENLVHLRVDGSIIRKKINMIRCLPICQSLVLHCSDAAQHPPNFLRCLLHWINFCRTSIWQSTLPSTAYSKQGKELVLFAIFWMHRNRDRRWQK